jgi:cholesterol transport system auxiliary component
MITPTRIVLAALLSVSIAGCLSLGETEPRRHHVLEPAVHNNPKKPANARAMPLIVAPMSASAFYETTEMAYSRVPGERAYYTRSSWTERPSLRITETLVARLQQSGAFKTVAHAGSGVHGDLVLNTHLAAFFHDAVTPPGLVRVEIVAELVHVAQRALIARKAFEHSAPARSYDAAGAVAAFNQATGAIVDDIAGWVDAVAQR